MTDICIFFQFSLSLCPFLIRVSLIFLSILLSSYFFFSFFLSLSAFLPLALPFHLSRILALTRSPFFLYNFVIPPLTISFLSSLLRSSSLLPSPTNFPSLSPSGHPQSALNNSQLSSCTFVSVISVSIKPVTLGYLEVSPLGALGKFTPQ